VKLRANQIEPVTIGVEFFKLPKMAPSIIVAPTAFGKSIVIAHIAKGIGEKVLVLQPSKELLEQNYNKFIFFGGSASIYSASMGQKELGDITYATIGSIINIAHKFREMGVSKIIIDECDRYPREKSGQLRRFVDGMKATHILGLTATPLKLQSNMGDTGPYSKLVMLTNRSSKGAFFKHIIHVAQIQDTVKLGFWTPLVYQSYDFDTGALVFNSSGAEFTNDSIARAYENQNIEDKIVKKVREIEDRKSILVAVPTIEQAIKLAGKIPMAAVVTGETPTQDRNRIIEEFRNQKIRVIVQVNVLTVGFDYPELDCLITARPTASISWWYQFVGRGTRIHEKKNNCLVVDFVGSVERFGKVEDLYYKEDKDGTWELYGENKKKITGVPIHEIGLHLEGGINLAEQRNEEGEIQKVYMTFGKYKNKPVASIPPYYRKWLLDNITWNPYNQKIKEEIIRLETIKKQTI
jgi:DNA repair protein RadD